MNLFIYLLLLPFALHLNRAQTPVTTPNTVIGECPDRSVPQLRLDATKFELSLLFYYVSWSSEARQARLVFDGVAKFYQDFAYFAAVDCWHLQCNCSRTVRPAPGGAGYPDKYPTMVVMLRHGKNVLMEYQGAWHFEDLSEFMNNLIRPLDRIQGTEELSALRKLADAVVLGLMDSPDGSAYKRFFAAAVHWLQLDPERNMRFTVMFGENARKMLKDPDDKLPQLVVIDSRSGVHSYNTTTNDWTTVDILTWVRSSLKGFSLISNGYGNPMTIASKARHMPVLAMGIKMHQQQESALPLVMGEEQAGVQRKQQEKCERYWRGKEEPNVSLLEMPKTDGRSTLWRLNEFNLANYYAFNAYLNQLWSQFSHQPEHQLPSQRPAQLMAWHGRNLCLAHTQHGSPSLKISIAKMVTKYGQLIWAHSKETPSQNRSLGVVLFDSIKHKDYLQQLGILQHQNPHSLVQVFIVDVADEALHVMPHHQAFSYVALKDFIRQFYARTLPRVHKNALLSMETSSYIYNYNRQLLLQALQRPNATQVVLIQRPDCGLCAVLSQAFLQVSALLKSPYLHFVRFDGQANDLPWELSMPLTPSLIVFPQSRPAESVIFPHDVRVDVQNVMAFILAQLEPEQQLRVVLSSCRRQRHVRSCLDFARNLVFQHVSQYLKYWEIYEKERDLILAHLKEFNELHIAVESSIRL